MILFESIGMLLIVCMECMLMSVCMECMLLCVWNVCCCVYGMYVDESVYGMCLLLCKHDKWVYPRGIFIFRISSESRYCIILPL